MVHYFANHFAEQQLVRSKLDGLIFPNVSDLQNELLIAPFSLEEIEENITCCEGDKSPGPDCFNFVFLKSCWNVLKDDVQEMFKEFYVNASIPKVMTSYFLALIPKISCL